MSTKQEHRERAEQNEFLITTLQNPFWDWSVTARFYAALQYVEAYLATKVPAVHSPNHTVRDAQVQTDAVLKPIWDDYRDLKHESRVARYDAHIPFTQVDAMRLQQNLDAIKVVVLPRLT